MYKVRGYAFESLEQAQIAQKEVEKIRYIRSKTKMDDPDAVLQIYRKLILQDVFETPVGIEFLKGLQEYLHTIPYIKYEDVLPIPVYAPEKADEPGSRSEKNIYRRKYHRSLFFAIHIDRYGFGKPDVADEFFFFDQLLISNNVVIDEGAVRFVRYGKVSDIHGSHIVKEMGPQRSVQGEIP